MNALNTGPNGNGKMSDNSQFINAIGICENHRSRLRSLTLRPRIRRMVVLPLKVYRRAVDLVLTVQRLDI